MTKKQVSQTHVLVCDFGFSAMKWLYGDAVGRFPSAYKKIDGGIVVGNPALREGDSNDVQTVDELVRLYPRFVEMAAQEAGVNDRVPLAIGLPYGTWKTEMLKERNGETSLIGGLVTALSASFRSVLVLPQGLGGIVAQVAGADGPLGDILGIDVGFNTVIVTLYSAKEKKVVMDQTFFGKGVKDLAVNHLMPRIEHHVGQDLNPIQVSHLMEKGYIRLAHFQKADIRPEIRAAAKEYCDDLLTYLIGYIKSKWSSAADFDTIVFFGGGSRLFQDIPTSKSLSIVVANEPEFANARGFAVMAEEEA